MIFSFFKKRRRERILQQPFPAAWRQALADNIWAYPLLDADARQRLEKITQVLVAEKNWEGCGGLQLNDEIKATVAAWAALLLLNLEHDYYEKTLSILIYPSSYQAMEPVLGGLDFHPVEGRLGEAWYRGPVILSWDRILEDGRHRGHANLAIHEFAHQLDMLNREADGVPPLENTAQYRSWSMVMSIEYEKLIEADEQGRPTLLDKYGAENEAEFFAVVSECFFEMPDLMREHHPRLYAIVKDYYRQDPAVSLARS